MTKNHMCKHKKMKQKDVKTSLVTIYKIIEITGRWVSRNVCHNVFHFVVADT